MDVRIGVAHTARELELEMPDDADPDAIAAEVEEALQRGTGVLWLTDRKGRRLGVAVERLSWVEIGSGADKGRIGFGAL